MRLLPARLPVPVRPAHHETAASYVARLAAVNGLPYEALWTDLGIPKTPGLRRRVVVAERLAAATGRELTALQRALPELRSPAPDWRQLRNLPQYGCPRCTASHPGGPVQQIFHHHEHLCTRHGYWIGPVEPAGSGPPRPLAGLVPELTAAQHLHNRLVRRCGWHAVFDAADASTSLCIDLRFTSLPSDPARAGWETRVGRLIATPEQFTTPLFYAAFYPEIVRLAAVFCSPHRQVTASLAATGERHRTALGNAISAALGHNDLAAAQRHYRYQLEPWIDRMVATTPTASPAKTFPGTRSHTLDGTPPRPGKANLERHRKATRQVANRGHIQPGACRETSSCRNAHEYKRSTPLTFTHF